MFYFSFFFFNKLIYYIHALFEFDLCVSSGEEWVLKFKKLKKCNKKSIVGVFMCI